MNDSNGFETRRQSVFQAMQRMRDKKTEIAETLRGLGVGDVQDDMSVKDLIEHLMNAYDSLCTQEKLWAELLEDLNKLEKKEE
ncbi:hypothetical protein L5515_003491 [Caenorhabditis briggsae]|uniref:Uncharacterized protein n=1 Tax=Caenorhabditis briggsae TaxID=6238 RepID=A0AAE9EIM0_CAEBR|nr:hypothetical protein L5515_003491 [Caenorhabditis briggsae]